MSELQGKKCRKLNKSFITVSLHELDFYCPNFLFCFGSRIALIFQIYMKKNIFAPVLCFYFFVGMWFVPLFGQLDDQGKQQIIEKIKSGEIQISPEMMQQGQDVLKTRIDEGKTAKSDTPRTMAITSGNDTITDSLVKNTAAIQKIKNPGLEEIYQSLIKATPEDLGLPMFGSDLLRKEGMAQGDASVPPVEQYVLGVSDEIVVYTWGRETATRSVFVDKDGYFNYPPLAPIRVAGLTFAKAQEAIKSSLENISGLQARISLGQLKSIRVMIIGDASQPGSYSLPSGTTVLNALMAYGGISDIGSLRSIEIKRNGRTWRMVDLYEILCKGNTKDDEQLVSGDALFIPVLKKKVIVAGFVKRPAIYEARNNETVADMLDYAGGLAPLADCERIVVERTRDNNEKIVLNVQYAPGDKKNNAQTIKVSDGDLIKVFPLLSKETNFVSVSGNVLAPGKYQYRDGLTVKGILPTIESYKPETFFDYGVVKRLFEPDFHAEYIPFSLKNIYSGGGDFTLKPRDALFIFNKWELLDTSFIVVEGNVRKPGRVHYVENMRVSDAIIAAGGFKEDTYKEETHVLKYSPEFSGSSLKRVNMESVLADYASDENIVLGPNDKVLVFSKWNFNFKDSVLIIGEVKQPGIYKLVKGMTVSDLIKQAGGYTEGTFKLYIEVVRQKIHGDSVEVEDVFKLHYGKDFGENVHFELQAKDNVYVRKIIDYGRMISIRLNGLFKFPGIYRAEKGEKLSSVISRAGGFRENAYLPGIVYTRKRVRERQQEHIKMVADQLERQLDNMLNEMGGGMSEEDKAYRAVLINNRRQMLEELRNSIPLGRVVLKLDDINSFAQSEYDVEVEDGDELAVNENLNTVTVMGEVFAPVTVVYSKENDEIGECLAKAGGINEYGDEDNIYLIKADGTVVTPKTISFFTVFSWVDVEPGATIVVPPKVPKKSLLGEMQQITSIIYNLAVTTGVVITLFK
ncbi:MAG: hypothetical protein A2268_13320 [Candidatus Raymondbacteria bacterium RifOxyA12_full_50_37]|uniref:Soluble ligand binding domain-containing protein n=1 Tax=Candidatus Raymondbacteria bacterium RIFOXYD12_FULL_49_13 TaxID=1817890 RepID=A0A1F7F0B8_UNCRA|nr:MAG: hypothetical protein A2268_13320 [Candidatus Raymondbacteria bacterium RifOxyA12_full_50_37]OGJ93042.1 MAG: hypothetical protein A2248_18455 [Candidatus Raymondbacteria bacterium RIFOXYA2_FULL_49_16]OGJ94875.1 MAG: hypothetical protein A2350_15510 [Candidatus Raymondbacteria bacterium RifOxyB12_full_50_8]OGJ99955.1 MAG: hypothetical protein A2519_00435 [Candidatus Raymondbacteria bacterium RIFOXYD12_FULL_49_13]OGK04146.1 MAG: hypothetical protein A2487_14115 [Candidatus Raymondbacteria 